MRLLQGAVMVAALVSIMSLPAQANSDEMPDRAAMERSLSTFWTAVSQGDVDSMVSVFAEDAVSQEPYGMPALEGPEAIRQFFQGLSGAFQTISFTRDRTHIAGNRAAVVWSANGTMADGTDVSFDGVDVVEFNGDGEIQRLWGYFEPLQPPNAG